MCDITKVPKANYCEWNFDNNSTTIYFIIQQYEFFIFIPLGKKFMITPRPPSTNNNISGKKAFPKKNIQMCDINEPPFIIN